MLPKANSIGLMGTSVASENRGVLALAASLVLLIKEAAPSVRLLLFLGHHDNGPASIRTPMGSLSLPISKVRLSPKSHPSDHLLWILGAALIYRFCPMEGIRQRVSAWTPWINDLLKTDVIADIRGGDSFTDLYGIGRFLHGFVLAWSVILVKGTLVQLPQTYGPFKSRVCRILAAFLLRRSSVVFARDKESQALAQSLAGPRVAVRLCPDVAFGLPAFEPPALIVLPSGLTRPPPGTIGMNINGLMYHGGYNRRDMFRLRLDYPRLALQIVEALVKRQSHEIWLVPHTLASRLSPESDPAAIADLVSQLSADARQRVRIVTGSYDCHELKWLIGQFDFFVGSRMHACIGALSQGVPCVGIAYSKKFRGVFETVGVADRVIDARECDNSQALAGTLARYEDRELDRAILQRKAQEARLELQHCFESLVTSIPTKPQSLIRE